MENLINFLAELLPIIQQYPMWVRWVVSAWILFTAAVLVILVVSRQPQQPFSPEIIFAAPPAQGVYLQIKEPKPGEEVGVSTMVSGATTLKSTNIYIVVIPLQTGERFIVDGPLAVDEKGSWSGRARLGEGNLGVGEDFAISALATKLKLREGPLPKLPGDHHMSVAVEVKRVE